MVKVVLGIARLCHTITRWPGPKSISDEIMSDPPAPLGKAIPLSAVSNALMTTGANWSFHQRYPCLLGAGAA